MNAKQTPIDLHRDGFEVMQNLKKNEHYWTNHENKLPKIKYCTVKQNGSQHVWFGNRFVLS
jgi:hypothetical protein